MISTYDQNVHGNHNPQSPGTESRQDKNSGNWQNHLLIGIGVAAAAAASVAVIAEIAILISEIVQDNIWKPNQHELESLALQKYSSDFIQKVKCLSHQGIDYIRLLKRLAITEQDETEIISYLEQTFEITPDQLKEILMGAHVRLDDDGETYEEWSKNIRSKTARFSSHPSNGTQYGVRGSVIKELLYSKSQESDGKSYTWFQLENHPVSIGHIIRHMIDYVQYKISNQNQGPYGSSTATDRTPIILINKTKGSS